MEFKEADLPGLLKTGVSNFHTPKPIFRVPSLKHIAATRMLQEIWKRKYNTENKINSLTYRIQLMATKNILNAFCDGRMGEKAREMIKSESEMYEVFEYLFKKYNGNINLFLDEIYK